jgi:predicted Zn-dependent protease with MMP-like domain
MTTRRERLSTYRALRRRPHLEADRFASLVAQVLAELPPPFRDRVDNVAIVVEERPSAALLRQMGLGPEQTLLGLYQGIPLHARGSGYTLVPPDRITLFREPILARCRSEAQVREEVRATLLHELGHYFGLGDQDLR